MAKILCLLTVVVFAFSACKKDNGPDPIAGFSINPRYMSSEMDATLTVWLGNDLTMVNSSENAESYVWDFGDGTTSTDKNPNVRYTTTGTYTLRLTAASSDGRKTVVSKTIKVVNLIAKQIQVTSLNPESALGYTSTSRYPTGDKLNVWVEILRAAPNQLYPFSSFGHPDAPLFYKTSVATYYDGVKMPLSLDISEKLVLEMPVINRCCGYSGLGYIYNLYAQDNTGTYLLSSSYASGAGFSTELDSRQKQFKLTSGFYGSHFSLYGEYQ